MQNSPVEFARKMAVFEYERNLQKASQFGILPVTSDNISKEWQDRLLLLGVWGVQRLNLLEPSNFCVGLGLKPTNLHLGHLPIISSMKFWIDLGAKPFLIFGSLERLFLTKDSGKHLINKIQTFVEQICEYTALEIINDIDCPLWIEWEAEVSKHIKLQKVKSLLGWKDSDEMIKFRIPALMVTALLAPQFFLQKPISTVFPCGINEIPYMELAKQVSDKLGLIPPTAIYHSLLSGMDGTSRMSSKNPKHTIFLSDIKEEIAKKLMKCVTGGREQYLHKQLGGQPETCQFFKICLSSISYDSLTLMLHDCLAGLPCKACKFNYISSITETIS